jgi:hypothetical protein
MGRSLVDDEMDGLGMEFLALVDARILGSALARLFVSHEYRCLTGLEDSWNAAI